MKTRFIDAFRALAAFWVLVAHCLLWGGGIWPGFPSPVMAVDLFMMISGFLMVEITRNEQMNDAAARMRFWLRRFFRIAPAYYLALAIALVAQAPFVAGYDSLRNLLHGGAPRLHTEAGWTNLLAHLTFTFGLSPEFSSSTLLPDWSLSLEMQFYLAFPAILLFLGSVGFVRGALILTVLSLILGAGFDSYYAFEYPSLLVFKLMHFLAGMLVWLAMSKRSALAGLAAVVLVSIQPHHHSAVLPVVCAAFLAIGLMEQSNPPQALVRILDSRLTRFASDTSYGVYLFHGFLISMCGLTFATSLQPLARSAAVLAVVVPSSYLLGYAVRRWVELPGIALGRKVIARRRSKRRLEMP